MAVGSLLTGALRARVQRHRQAERVERVAERFSEHFAESITVKIPGLNDLRRDFRAMGPDATKEFRAVIKDAGEIVARDAAAFAPRRTGRLANAYRSSARGTSAIVRNRVPYAHLIEFGFHPRGSTTFVPGPTPIGRAVERQEDVIVEAMAKGFDKVARAHGFH